MKRYQRPSRSLPPRRTRRESKRSVSRVFAVTLKRSITANLTRWRPKNRCRSRRYRRTDLRTPVHVYRYRHSYPSRENRSCLLINCPSIPSIPSIGVTGIHESVNRYFANSRPTTVGILLRSTCPVAWKYRGDSVGDHFRHPQDFLNPRGRSTRFFFARIESVGSTPREIGVGRESF